MPAVSRKLFHYFLSFSYLNFSILADVADLDRLQTANPPVPEQQSVRLCQSSEGSRKLHYVKIRISRFEILISIRTELIRSR